MFDDALGPCAVGARVLGLDGMVAGIVGVSGQLDAEAGLNISSAAARGNLEERSSDAAISRGHLGIQTRSLTQELVEALGLEMAEGALVMNVEAGEPAKHAGIREGDVVLALDDGEVADLSRRVCAVEPGDKVGLQLDVAEKFSLQRR